MEPPYDVLKKSQQIRCIKRENIIHLTGILFHVNFTLNNLVCRELMMAYFV